LEKSSRQPWAVGTDLGTKKRSFGRRL